MNFYSTHCQEKIFLILTSLVLFRGNNVKAAPPTVRPKSFKPPTVTATNTPVRMEFKLKSEDDHNRRRQQTPTNNNNTDVRKVSSEDDAPPRPPPPKSVTPSPRASQQFAYSTTTNGYQDSDYVRSASVGKRPSYDYNASNGSKPTVNHGTDEPEVMDFRTKMKLFNKFQNN